MGRVVIISGTHRRRVLCFPDLLNIRPTPHRLRETLFNWLGPDLMGYTCLDLFAGSGALGFEAASRGASRVDMVERHLSTFQSLFLNRQSLLFHNVQLFCSAAEKFAQRMTEQRYDVIFCDPPFREELPSVLTHFLESHLQEEGYLYWEQSMHKNFFFKDSPVWRIMKHTRVGESAGYLLQKRAQTDGYDRSLCTE